MSGIVLSASVRQNLLSLQSTADLLATTQNRLSTGKSVNSALDNPTNFFTAQSLDNRASDINNLLDGIASKIRRRGFGPAAFFCSPIGIRGAGSDRKSNQRLWLTGSKRAKSPTISG